MKKIIFSLLLLIFIQNLCSQQIVIPHFFLKDCSYLILNEDTAEFRMHNVKYGIRYIKGKGTYYIKDKVIYISTIRTDDETFTRWEDVGQSELQDKISIEVFNENNIKISNFIYEIVGEKFKNKNNKYREVFDNELDGVDLNKVERPNYLWINAISDNYFDDELNETNYSRSITIPIESIKTDKIIVYLKCDKLIYDKIVRFELGKDEQGFFVFGPKGIYIDESVKTKSYFLKRKKILAFYSNKKLKMYSNEL